MSQAGKQRAGHHHGAPECRTHPHKLSALNEINIELSRLEGVLPFRLATNLDSHHLKKRDQVLNVKDFRDIGHLDFLCCKKDGANDLKSLVLSSLRNYGTT